jgi:hypothetical protein
VLTFDDWHAIHEIIMTYAEHIDEGRFAEAAALFEHATLRIDHRSVEYRGAAETEKFFAARRVFEDGSPRTRHLYTNLVIEVDGDRAEARYYATAFQQTDELPLQPIACGRYIDQFERVDRKWRLADRLITQFLLGDRSQHVPLANP